MKRHSTDLLALFFGIAVTVIAGIALATQLSGIDSDPRWGIAITFIVLGTFTLVATLARTREPATCENAEPPEVPADSWTDSPTATGEAVEAVSEQEPAS